MTQDGAIVVPRSGVAGVTPGVRASSARARMKVALIQTQAEGAGAQEIARILGRGLDSRGFEAHQVFFFRRTAAFDGQPNTFFCATERPTGLVSLARMFVALVRHLRKVRPNAVLCFQHYGNLVGAVAARLAGVRVIVANRTSARSLEPWWTRALDFVFGTTGWFSSVVVNSHAVAEEYGAYPARYRARIVKIEHGFETKTSTLSRRLARDLFDLPQDVPLLGCVARLHPAKNLDAAVRLLTTDPTWHLALAGQGAARVQLEELAASLGVADRLHFVGEQNAERIGAFLRALDVFVFPSLAETFGLAVVEAAQAGVPVVANDLDVLHEVLAVDGVPCALFADARDSTSFAAAVRRILGDDILRERLSSLGAGLARRYSLDDMVTRYQQLIETLKDEAREDAR